jgi:hypothetical protein
MRKINYPNNPAALSDFHKRYCSALIKVNKIKINIELKKAPVFDKKVLDFDMIVTMDFENLYRLKDHLKTFLSNYDYKIKIKKKTIIKNSFNDLFDYSINQPYISSFFMQEEYPNIKTCYYCSIDFINSFKDIGDYINNIDFLNRGTYEDLKIIKGIGTVMANRIINQRKGKRITSCNEITNNVSILDQLNKFDFQYSHNHFTLDHVLPQKDYKFLSLCLYNLVPSCYSCNAKFKKANNFILDNHLSEIVPTSKRFALTDDFQFKIFYSGKMENIKSVSDFVLYREVYRNSHHLNKYASIFKIDGRYNVHKHVVLDLIRKKIKFSNKQIAQMAHDLGKGQDEMRKIIFGEELFVENFPAPLHKLKHDIAKDIKII